MTKFTDTQRIILSAASQRTDRLALPLPKSLKGGAMIKVIRPLIEKGLLEEVDANRKLNDPVWRKAGDGHGVTLIITDTGLEAIGIEPDDAKKPAAKAIGTKAPATPKESKIRNGTKQALVIEMLRRPEGATLAEIVEATHWAQHTCRGFLAGAVKKKLGLAIASCKDQSRGRVYKIEV